MDATLVFSTGGPASPAILGIGEKLDANFVADGGSFGAKADPRLTDAALATRLLIGAKLS